MRNYTRKLRNWAAIMPCLLIPFTPVPTIAQTIFHFDELVISGSHTPTNKNLTGSANTVLNAEQIERTGVIYAVDALRQVPGVTVSQSGPSGALAQVRIRGSEANHVLVLIDGVEMNSPGDGEFDFSRLLAANIERIEVIRGAQSGIYGANAHAGVINIITRSGRGEDGLTSHAFAEYGSFDTVTTGVGFTAGVGPIDMAFNIAHNRTDGFNIAPTGNEDDGSFNTTVTGKVGVDLNQHFRLETVLRVVDRMSETDNQFTQFVTDGNNRSDGRDVAGRVALLGEFMDGALTSKAQYSGSRTELVSFFGAPAFFFGSEATRLNYSWQTDYRFSSNMFGGTDHTITGFIEHETQQFFQFGPFAAPLLLGQLERDMTGIAGEYRIEFGDTSSISGALRHDINDAFDDATTWRLTGSHRLVNLDTRFHASVGRGVTNPTMIEQFGFFPPFVGNPNLTPESSISWDAGIEQAFHDGAFVIDVTYFSAVLEDEIVTRFILGASTPINLAGESKRRGVEVSANWNPNANWSFNGSYTYTHSEEPGGIPEIRRPNHQASASLTHNFADGRAHLTLNALYNGEMPDTVFTFPVAGTTILDDFFVVGVTGSFEVRDGVEVYGRVTNLFDEDYQEVFSFETAGVAAYAGVRVKFGHSAR